MFPCTVFLRKTATPNTAVESRGRVTSSDSRSRSRRDPSIESAPELPRPHCDMCGAKECLRPWLDDRCHCDACLGIEKGDCDSPRMRSRRAAKPSCESFYASKCLKHTFAVSAPLKVQQPAQQLSRAKKQYEDFARAQTLKKQHSQTQNVEALDKQQSTIKVKSEEKTGQFLAANRTIKREQDGSKIQQTIPSPYVSWNDPKSELVSVASWYFSGQRPPVSPCTFLRRSTKEARGLSSSRGRSTSRKRDPSIESVPDLLRPHCEMCGAAECLRPWLDDRCHCNACLGLDQGECDSPRMKTRRASMPCCESFLASKCQKHLFEKKATTIPKQVSQRQPKKLPSMDKEPAEIPTSEQAPRALDKQRSRTRQQPSAELKEQSSASTV